MSRIPARLAAILALGTALAACQATVQGAIQPGAGASASPGAAAREIGDTKTVFGANVSTYAVPEGTTGMSEVGFELPLALVEATPTGALPPTITALKFPESVRRLTFIDHLNVDYNPAGHPPAGVYGVPHFDFHFYGIDEATQAAIDCKDVTMPATDRMPQGYALIPPGAVECVPAMGMHAPDLSSPELAPSSPGPFTKTMILGFYAGKQNFIEPMVTREYLLTKQDFTLAVGRPTELGRTTLYPSTFEAKFDAAKNNWVFALKGFTPTTK
jgi:hypothetical protein